MKTFTCQCGTRLHYENTLCVNCQRELGFLPDAFTLSALSHINEGIWQAAENGLTYRKCRNYQDYQVCNWLVPETDTSDLCFSCRLTEIIPDLSKSGNIELWRYTEIAKRRLLYGLQSLGLPIYSKQDNPQHGLSFRLIEDQVFSEFEMFNPLQDRVITGHNSGTITLNIAEADPVYREEHRANMQEGYRTLLGHFRHESGHYYWDLLLRDTPLIEEFRILFGDERNDYDAALKRYYANGTAENWEATWISAYASAHPWEDWAETWAHYLHIVDTLETARDYGFDPGKARVNTQDTVTGDASPVSSVTIHDLVNEWGQLSVALNDMNRSMGLIDAYPFVLSETIIRKLAFVHAVANGYV